MNLIAIETATPACAVGVRTTSRIEVTRVVNDGRRHTEALAGALGLLLDEVGLVPRDISKVIVDRGPGLFTGLRVGIATAIGFAQALGIELVGVTSLEMLAGGAFDAGVRGTLVACVDGRRGEVFTQTFALDDLVTPIDQPRVTTAQGVADDWVGEARAVTFTGDGVERYLETFRGVAQGALCTQSVPSLHAALEIGQGRVGDEVLVPLYLREADAVANFSTRQRP
jgi:tRNA threonylcarbamoyl adenosine modification protein YeaZ